MMHKKPPLPTPRGVTVILDYEPDIRMAAATLLAILGDTDAPEASPDLCDPTAPTRSDDEENRR